MLTKDLLRYTIQKEKIRPSLVDPKDPTRLSCARQLLEVFESAKGKSREVLLEESKEVADRIPVDAIFTRGLEKILLDHTEFDSTPDDALMDLRKELFQHTSRLLAKRTFTNLEDYHKAIQETYQGKSETQHVTCASRQLYVDLPSFQQVLHFKSFSPENLLHRYNCAQVQGLLQRCNRLYLRIADKDPIHLRPLCRSLRFHQLLAEITVEANGEYCLAIDGPLDLFLQTQKYGINLANFFPAILLQPRWQLQAQVRLNQRKQYLLLLDESCKIRSHYRQFSAYIPEEIEMFQKSFLQKSQSWTVEPGKQFLQLTGEFYCFPDYLLKHPSAVEVFMELFHAWHASHLTVRLRQLEKARPSGTGVFPLMIGVAKSLLKDPAVAQAVDQSRHFSKAGFIFRKMPPADKVLLLLEQFVDNMPLFSQQYGDAEGSLSTSINKVGHGRQ